MQVIHHSLETLSQDNFVSKQENSDVSRLSLGYAALFDSSKAQKHQKARQR